MYLLFAKSLPERFVIRSENLAINMNPFLGRRESARKTLALLAKHNAPTRTQTAQRTACAERAKNNHCGE